MKPGTFGKSPAARRLAAIINELSDPKERGKATRRVTSTLHTFARGLKFIEAIPDVRVKKTLLTLWGDKFRAGILNSKSAFLQASPMIRSHTACVMAGMVSAIRETLDQPPKGSKATTDYETICFIVNGQAIALTIQTDAPLRESRDRALTLTQNTGRRPEDWDIRNSEGVLLSPDSTLAELPDSRESLFLVLKVGVGGGQP